MNAFSVIHVPADQVGTVLGIAALVCVGSLVLAFVMRDAYDGPNRTLLSVASAAAIAFVTLGLSSL